MCTSPRGTYLSNSGISFLEQQVGQFTEDPVAPFGTRDQITGSADIIRGVGSSDAKAHHLQNRYVIKI